MNKILLRYEGQSHEVEVARLDIPENPVDGDLKTAVERHLNLTAGSLRDFEVDRYSDSAVIRPQAKFGVIICKCGLGLRKCSNCGQTYCFSCHGSKCPICGRSAYERA